MNNIKNLLKSAFLSSILIFPNWLAKEKQESRISVLDILEKKEKLKKYILEEEYNNFFKKNENVYGSESIKKFLNSEIYKSKTLYYNEILKNISEKWVYLYWISKKEKINLLLDYTLILSNFKWYEKNIFEINFLNEEIFENLSYAWFDWEDFLLLDKNWKNIFAYNWASFSEVLTLDSWVQAVLKTEKTQKNRDWISR